MSRKSKPSKQKKSVTTSLPQVDRYLDLIGQQIFQGNYSEAVSNCERLLNYLPRHAPQRVDVLAQLGTAQGMLQNFPQSYEAFSEALALNPNDAGLWFNPSMASRFTLRFGRALRDVERAIELNTRSELAEQFAEAPAVVNLFDPAISTRRRLLDLIRSHGWRGRMVWLPIPLFALLVSTARFALSLVRLRLPSRLAVWSIFRPRRYNSALSAKLLDAAVREPARAVAPRAPQLQS